MVWRIVASSRSPAPETPPPITSSDGLKKLTTPVSIWPINRPASVISSTLTWSPCFEASATSAALDEALLVEDRAQNRASALPRRRLAVAGERRASREGFEAAAHAAAADHLAVAGRHVDVTDVARRALGAAMDSSVDDDARADPGADLDEDEVLDAAAAARRELAERHHVHVVVEPHGHAAPGEPRAHVVPVPPRHDRRRDRQRRLELDGARNADPDPPEASRQGRRLRLALVEELLDACEHRVRSGRDVGALGAVDEDLAREIGERDVHARRAEVGDEQVARVGAETEQPRRPASSRRAEAVLGEEAVVEERVDALRDDRPAEAGRLDEAGAGRLAVDADVVEHRHEPVRRGHAVPRGFRCHRLLGLLGARGHFRIRL